MKLVKRTILALAAVLAIAYLSDFAILRYRIAANRNAFGTVTVQKFYSIKEKNGRIEFSTGDSEDVPCVNSLLPHSGYTPCWYLRRHTEQQINI